MSGTAKRFFDNCWDAIETLGLSDMYSAYSTISDFAPDLITIISNANSLEMYRNADETNMPPKSQTTFWGHIIC